jgi:hypothetical protein
MWIGRVCTNMLPIGAGSSGTSRGFGNAYRSISERGYENQVSSVVAKLLLRGKVKCDPQEEWTVWPQSFRKKGRKWDSKGSAPGTTV